MQSQKKAVHLQAGSHLAEMVSSAPFSKRPSKLRKANKTVISEERKAKSQTPW